MMDENFSVYAFNCANCTIDRGDYGLSLCRINQQVEQFNVFLTITVYMAFIS